MDAFVLLSAGSPQARSVQQWLNGSYVGRRDFFIAPCDGFFSRDVQKNLLLGIQYQIGMSDEVANGRFGPGTQDGLRRNVQSEGSTGTWVQLFSGAMILNRRSGVVFTSVFDAALASKVREFQTFAGLQVNGQGDYPTWASLLVSTGDTSRPGTACDCVTTVTPARAAALYSAGYRVVGRYLSNAPGSSLNKRIQPGELAAVVQGGLRAFPIYQTNGGSAGYFSYGQGVGDAFSALEWARQHGFRAGTRIYFAVDFDSRLPDYGPGVAALPRDRRDGLRART
jgi:peptidoglycan hydrolase-like protein with peptidoglycan-binding domain